MVKNIVEYKDEMNTIQEFSEKVQKDLQDYFGDTKQVSVNKVMKNNGLFLTGVTLQSEKSNVAPTIYIDTCYERYKRGEIYAQLIHELIETLERHIVNRKMDMRFFEDFAHVKGNIAMKLINKNRNEDLLKDIPYVDYLDMALVFYYILDGTEFEEGLSGMMFDNANCKIGATILVHNTHLHMWDISKDELFESAKENTRKKLGVSVENLTELIKSMILNRLGSHLDDDEAILHMQEMLAAIAENEGMKKMLVLSNDSRQYGAVNLFFNDVLMDISKKYSSDLIILPSSIHEVIIIVNDYDFDAENLKSMVKSVNSNEVPIEDILSDSVYYFEREHGEIRLIG